MAAGRVKKAPIPEETRRALAERLARNRAAYFQARADRGVCKWCENPPVRDGICAIHLSPDRPQQTITEGRKAHVQRRLKAGKCTRCGFKNDRPGRYLCSECNLATAERSNKRRARRRVKDRCRCGKRPREGFATCAHCAELARKQAQAGRDRRAAAGLCRGCNRPRVPDRAFCEKHLREHREGKARRDRLRRAVG